MAPKTRAQRNSHGRTKEVEIVEIVEISSPDSDKGKTPSGAEAGSINTNDFDIDMDSDLEALIDECVRTEDALTPISQPAAEKKSLSAVPLKRNLSQTSTTSSNRRAISDRPRFRLVRPAAPEPHHITPTVPETDDSDLVWWQRYEPRTADDLALHVAKTAQVREWLQMATSDTYGSQIFRLLVLEGPPGSCKSTSIRVLAADMGVEIVEWINPLAERQSVAGEHHDYDDQDDDMRVGVVRQFDDFLRRAERYSNLELHADDRRGPTHGTGRRSKIILVDDLPNLGHRDTRDAFVSSLTRFVATPAARSFPMVIVVTECFAMHQILGDYDESPARYRRMGSDDAVWSATDVIPPSVYQSQLCQAIKFNPVAPTIVAKGLKRILVQQAGGSQKAAKLHAATVKRISAECNGDLRQAITMLQMSEAADHVSRDSTGMGKRTALDLFHALGKVLYAKRTQSSSAARGTLESDPDDILDRVPMDPDTFSLYVHENYVDFCSSIDELADAAELLSESDAIAGQAGGGWSAAGARVASAYAAMISVRGFMNVRGHPRYAVSGDASAMMEEGSRRRRGMAAFRKPAFFDSYKRKTAFGSVWLMAGANHAPGNRHSAVLDVLPYWAHIASKRGALLGQLRRHSPAFAQLMQLATVGRDDGCDTTASGYWTAVARDTESAAQLDDQSTKLVLSDDDIQDFSD
ncbi:Cell cycle checkpoint protein rad17 [Coemansia sp. RSA 1933]|nr:Cell cycle checkpoint protein rad17 [Coemansia sp. RSA 1933]